ncbi:MAG: hypothetical protein J4F35_16395 [Candidatus Latescibacteria bacterium]|nr:hypothetical protein [Candidatus Latescibacterota bacterium]
MFAQLNHLMALLILYGLLVQPAQAEHEIDADPIRDRVQSARLRSFGGGQ